MRAIIFLLLICYTLIFPEKLQAQESQIEIVQAEALAGGIINGVEVRILRRNVIVRHQGMTLYCDSAYQYLKENNIDAFGRSRLINSDGATVTSNKMFYEGNVRMAKAIGDVVVTDEGKTLYTEELDYDLNGKLIYYSTGGKIVDAENLLTSQTGTYDVNSKIYYFTQNVVLQSLKDGDRLETNNLQYNSVTGISYFQGPSKITTKDGAVLYSDNGTYNTRTKESNFRGRPRIEDDKYILSGDSLYYDDQKKIGVALGNVRLTAKLDSVIIDGDVGRFWNREGISKVYGNAIMRQIAEKDTLYLTADTLLSINNENTKLLKAYYKTRIYRKDLQAICDSLVYNRRDSVIQFFRDPVVWSKGNQMTADSIDIALANNKIHKMYLKNKSFVISQDTVLNFNQLKGKYITAHFNQSNQIQRIDVKGNGESIYFVLEEGDTTLLGMNRAICTDMYFLFKEDNKLEIINYITKPDAEMIPPHELQEPQKKIKGFVWRKEERPSKEEMLRRRLLIF
ncbi:MAG: hypothetical protein EAZ55_04055 [Cytophagales bacterium]|nr:MAG: hypothetical protein EAZ55_04055 [Cytophagales bacterium]